MNLGHNFTKLFSLPLTVFVCFFFSIYPLAVLSNETNSNNEEESNQNELNDGFENRGSPENDTSGTNRGGSCLVVHNNKRINLDFEVTPLMYGSNRDTPLVTYQDNPTLWFWVKVNNIENLPLDQLPKLGFNIIQFDDKNNVGDIQTIHLSSESSVVYFSLEPNSTLELNQLYELHLRIQCNPQSPDEDIILLNGFIKMALERLDEREPDFLVDGINEAIQSVCGDPNNPTLREEWKKVLIEANIEDPETADELVKQPLDCQRES